MAFTLEAAIVIPVTMFLTVSILTSSINLYEKIETESYIESESLWYAIENDDIWSCRINNTRNSEWSKMIAVNPVKIKSLLEFVIDTTGEVKGIFPVLKEMEALFFENKQQ